MPYVVSESLNESIPFKVYSNFYGMRVNPLVSIIPVKLALVEHFCEEVCWTIIKVLESLLPVYILNLMK